MDEASGGSLTSRECIKLVEELIISKKYKDALRVVTEESGKVLMEEAAMELIPIVCRYIVIEAENDSIDLLICCQEILDTLAANGNAKEMLIGLLEQAESSIEDYKFEYLLTPIQTVLQRLPGKKVMSLQWVLEVMNARVKNLPVPKTYDEDKEERRQMEFHPSMEKMEKILSQLMKFYEPFIYEVCLTSCNCDEKKLQENAHQRDVLTRSLLGLLDYPLAYVCLDHNQSYPKGPLRIIAEQIMYFVTQLQSNIMKLFSYLEDPDEKCEVTTNSIATLCYLVYDQNVEIFYWPKIFCHLYLLESLLPVINSTISASSDFVKSKGLRLGASFLARLPDERLTIETLDLRDHTVFAQTLINVTTSCGIQEFRSLSVSILQEYALKYELSARYHLLKGLLLGNEHPGVQGLLIQLFKSNVIESLQKDPPLLCFVGLNLREILSIIVPLRNGITTDLLDQSDRIMGTLNFLRYLALMDNPSANITSFWNMITFIEHELMNPLARALELSRAHYQTKLTLQEEMISVDSDASADTSNKDRSRSVMDPTQCLQVLHSALNTFDMIEGVLVRVREIIDAGKAKVHIPQDVIPF